jgi:hypothetical protein
VVRMMTELYSRSGGPHGLRRGYAGAPCWDSAFSSCRGHGCPSFVNCVRCTGRSLSAKGRSFVQGSLTECGVSEREIERDRQTERDRQRERESVCVCVSLWIIRSSQQ